MNEQICFKYSVRCNDPDRYLVEDICISDITISKTTLYPDKCTKGHSHSHTELYYFISGVGQIVIGENTIDVGSETNLTIPEDSFHKVYNTGDTDLVFVAVWEN
jgi:mannose-6-phosphate isomerase-like protein (cupin superfamily)